MGPEPAAPPPHDTGKGSLMLLDVGANERPLTTKEREEVDSLTSVQVRNLAERFRAEFAEEARSGHRAELLHELQTNYDRELAAALEARDKEIAGLQDRLSNQQRGHDEAMRAVVQDKERLRQELDQHRNQSGAEKARAESQLNRAAEESRRLEEAIAGLEKEREAWREREASRASGEKSEEEERLEASLRRAEEEAEGAKKEKRGAEARGRGLLLQVLGLEREKTELKDELKRKMSSSDSALGTANAERLRWKRRAEDLQADLREMAGRIAACEVRLEEVRGEKEGLVADVAAAQKAAKGERGMDSPLGAPERAIEGSLRPLSHQWTEFLFWWVVALLLGLLVVLTSESNLPPCRSGPGLNTWSRGAGGWIPPEDPRLILSRGMYGVG